jgi:hypothetical protein
VPRKSPPRRAIDWRAHRIVPSRFPPVGPWDRIADPADFEALAEVEALTNPRIREERGALALVPPHRRVSGPGTTPIMAAFTHLNPEGSRFSDGGYGVYYAAKELETALRETIHHRQRFLARTREPPTRIEMRCYTSRIAATFHDIRGGHAELHLPDDYKPSQAFARGLHAQGSDGIVYDSVRRPGGQCVAVFWPDRVGPCRQSRHYAYCWDGRSITDVLELSTVKL